MLLGDTGIDYDFEIKDYDEGKQDSLGLLKTDEKLNAGARGGYYGFITSCCSVFVMLNTIHYINNY